MKPSLANYSSVAFILDAGHDVEQGLLENWVDELVQQSDYSGSAPRYVVSISRNPEQIPSAGLSSIVDLPIETWVIPVRVVWLPIENVTHRLLPFLESSIRMGALPSNAQAKRIVEKSFSRVSIVAGEGASLGDLSSRYEAANDLQQEDLGLAVYIAGQAGLALDIAGRKIIGGRYKVPRRVADNLKASKLFKDALDSISKETKRPVADLLDESDSIMQELVATPQPFWLDVSAHITKKITSLAYESEIVVDKQDIAKLKGMVSNNPSALLWTHKTHVDGMAIQKVMYENDIPPAHTFGGLNMAFAGLGYMSRRAGVIFIRRTFQDNPLYKAILRLYMGYLLEKKFPFSWAFEGTRSRMGKLMPPRYGLLKYLIEAAHTTDAKNLHIIPVAINYDMIGDVSDYAKEQLGEKKSAESLKWFVGYIRGLRQPMGRIYLNLGTPVVLEKAPDTDDRLALSKIAFQVAVEANRVTPITLASLVTMILLSAAPRALTRHEVSFEVEQLVNWANQRQIPITSDFDASNSKHAQSIIDVLVNNKMLSRFDDNSIELFSIAPEEHAQASYYRNTTIHHFLVKAFAEVALLRASLARRNPVEVFWEEVAWLKDLFKFEFFYSSSDEFQEEVRAELIRFDPQWESKLLESASFADILLKSFKPLVAHATLIQYAEAYWLTASVLAQLDHSVSADETLLVNSALKYGRQAYLQQRISSKSSIGKQLFKNAFQLLENLELNQGGAASVGSARINFQESLRKLVNRLERIRARALPQ